MANTLLKYEKEIKSVIYDAIVPCYGVKEIANISPMKGKKEEGIKIDFLANKAFKVSIYVVVVYGLKITETLRSTQKMIRSVLNHYYPNLCRGVSVYAYDMVS